MDDSSRPSLLFGFGTPPSKDELLADIPPRPVADRLIARFLNSGDPSLGKYAVNFRLSEES
jgi:hypothetical protein